jgi:exopolyphosphatase/pppGpp-phosphohydrolase
MVIDRRRIAAVSALPFLACPWTPSSAAAERQPMCAIDMGSNTFRRIVASFEDGRYVQTNIEKRTLGVGDDVAAHGRISHAKLAEIQKVLAEFKSSCAREGASPVAAIGTAAFRAAPNGSSVVEAASKLGIPMEIASERRESELAYLVGSLGRDGHAVIDNGSRSIELVSRDDTGTRDAVFDLGYRVAYEKFFASADDAAAAADAFRHVLLEAAATAPFMKGKTKLVGLEFGEMVDVLFDPAPLEGRVLSLAALQQRLREITGASPAEFQALKRKKDIDRALPRLVVAALLTEEFGYPQLELTERELGTGLIIEAHTAAR